MFIIALDYLAQMTKEPSKADKLKILRTNVARNVRTHLWDVQKQKFRPHIYLDKSPIPAGFDESKVYYHGGMGKPYIYQNGGDWTWFGARMIQQLIVNGFEKEAYAEIRPMIDLVIKNSGFYEWYYVDGKPHGSAQFKGSAGTLAKAVQMLKAWAEKNK